MFINIKNSKCCNKRYRCIEFKQKRFIIDQMSASFQTDIFTTIQRFAIILWGRRNPFSLLFIVLFSGITAALALLQVLSLDATSTSTTERRLEREVNVLLAVQTNDERWDVDNLLADTKSSKTRNKLVNKIKRFSKRGKYTNWNIYVNDYNLEQTTYKSFTWASFS